MESAWDLVAQLLHTVIDKICAGRLFASEAVNGDVLLVNGIFLSAAVEELQVLQAFAKSNWRNHKKISQTIVRFMCETSLPCSVYKNCTDSGAHGLQIKNTTMLVEKHTMQINVLLTSGYAEEQEDQV